LKLALGIVDRLVVLGGVDIERSGGRDPDEGERSQAKGEEKEGRNSFWQKRPPMPWSTQARGGKFAERGFRTSSSG
jgi:hypothetical protein